MNIPDQTFEKDAFGLPELAKPECLLHIDSTTLRRAEDEEVSGEAEDLRRKVDTVG